MDPVGVWLGAIAAFAVQVAGAGERSPPSARGGDRAVEQQRDVRREHEPVLGTEREDPTVAIGELGAVLTGSGGHIVIEPPAAPVSPPRCSDRAQATIIKAPGAAAERRLVHVTDVVAVDL